MTRPYFAGRPGDDHVTVQLGQHTERIPVTEFIECLKEGDAVLARVLANAVIPDVRGRFDDSECDRKVERT